MCVTGCPRGQDFIKNNTKGSVGKNNGRFMLKSFEVSEMKMNYARIYVEYLKIEQMEFEGSSVGLGRPEPTNKLQCAVGWLRYFFSFLYSFFWFTRLPPFL